MTQPVEENSPYAHGHRKIKEEKTVLKEWIASGVTMKICSNCSDY